MAKLNKTKFALLGILSMGPCSGYDIKRKCDNSVAHFWNENYAHIYPVLKELEREGAVTSETEKQEGRPAKNVYTITPVGQEMLSQWLTEPVEKLKIRNEFLLKLFFSSQLPKEQVYQLIMGEKEKCEKEKMLFEHQSQLIINEPSLDDHPQRVFWLTSLNYGKHSADAIIKWCDETLPLFQSED